MGRFVDMDEVVLELRETARIHENDKFQYKSEIVKDYSDAYNLGYKQGLLAAEMILHGMKSCESVSDLILTENELYNMKDKLVYFVSGNNSPCWRHILCITDGWCYFDDFEQPLCFYNTRNKDGSLCGSGWVCYKEPPYKGVKNRE